MRHASKQIKALMGELEQRHPHYINTLGLIFPYREVGQVNCRAFALLKKMCRLETRAELFRTTKDRLSILWRKATGDGWRKGDQGRTPARCLGSFAVRVHVSPLLKLSNTISFICIA